VAVFELKQIRNPSTGDPIHWTYDRAEVIADGVVHVIGVSLGIIAIALCIFQLAAGTDRYGVVVYTIVLATMLGLSAAYNLWPVSPRKWLLRRFDTPSFTCSLQPPIRRSYRKFAMIRML
jgi:hemolysin III